MKNLFGLVLAFAVVFPAAAQTVRLGFLNTYSGPFASLGEYVDKGARLYMKLNADKLPPGVKIDLVVRDAGGPNPDKAKQLAQEMIVRDRIQILTGLVFTPNAFAIAPLVSEAKIPTAIMNAGTSAITTRSPYIARFSFTLWQSSYPFGQWAAKNISAPTSW
jgi:branched-chain amino acid transport system substrate-binding protein